MIHHYIFLNYKSVAEACQQLFFVPEKIIFVLNSNSIFTSCVTPQFIPKYNEYNFIIHVEAIYEKGVFPVQKNDFINSQAINIIDKYLPVKTVPVVFNKVIIISLFKYWQIYLKKTYFRAIRTKKKIVFTFSPYIVCIWKKIQISIGIKIGYISVLKFVAANEEGLKASKLLAIESQKFLIIIFLFLALIQEKDYLKARTGTSISKAGACVN